MCKVLIITDNGSYVDDKIEDPTTRLQILTILGSAVRKNPRVSGYLQMSMDYFGSEMTHQEIADKYNVSVGIVVKQIHDVYSRLVNH